MPSTNFVDYSTVIRADWLNDVNAAVYSGLGGGKTPSEIATTLGPYIKSLGTVTQGTWEGSVIAGRYGGTGVANTGKTITLGGNLTTGGTFNATGNVSINGNLQLGGTFSTDAEVTFYAGYSVRFYTTGDYTYSLPQGTTTLLGNDVPAILNSGFSAASWTPIIVSSGSYTPDWEASNMQAITNAGSFTLMPPTRPTSIILEVTNNESAGVIDTSNFTKVSGSFTSTPWHKFICSLIKTTNYSLLQIQGLQ